MPVFVAHTKREEKKKINERKKKCHVCNKEPYLQARLLPSPPPLSEWTAAFWLAAGSSSLSLHLVFFPFAPDWLWLREVSAPRFEQGIKKCGACWWRRRPSPVPGVAAQSFAQRTSWSLNPQCFRCCRRDTRGAGLFLDAHRNCVWILNIDSPNKRSGFSESAPSSPGVCKSNTQWSQHFNQVEGQHWYSLGKSSSG